MDKSGQGLAALPQIIDDAKLRSPLRIFFEGSITAALWATWIYFIMPVVTLVLWVIGISAGYNVLFLKDGLWELLEIFRMAAWALLLIFSLNFVWIFYNVKFASGRPKVAQKLGSRCPIEIAGIEQVGKNNRIELAIDADGPKIIAASTLTGPAKQLAENGPDKFPEKT